MRMHLRDHTVFEGNLTLVRSLQCLAERWFGMEIGGYFIPEGWMVGGVEIEMMVTFLTDGKWEG